MLLHFSHFFQLWLMLCIEFSEDQLILSWAWSCWYLIRDLPWYSPPKSPIEYCRSLYSHWHSCHLDTCLTLNRFEISTLSVLFALYCSRILLTARYIFLLQGSFLRVIIQINEGNNKISHNGKIEFQFLSEPNFQCAF